MSEENPPPPPRYFHPHWFYRVIATCVILLTLAVIDWFWRS